MCSAFFIIGLYIKGHNQEKEISMSYVGRNSYLSPIKAITIGYYPGFN